MLKCACNYIPNQSKVPLCEPRELITVANVEEKNLWKPLQILQNRFCYFERKCDKVTLWGRNIDSIAVSVFVNIG